MADNTFLLCCKDCQKRKLNCHSSCLKYRLIKIWHDGQTAKIRAIKQSNYDCDGFITEAVRRNKK